MRKKSFKSLYNKNKELIPHKGIYEISEDILDRPYCPQPKLAEDMKIWEAQLDRDIKTTWRHKNNDNTLTSKVKISKLGRQNDIFVFPNQASNLIEQHTHINSSFRNKNLDKVAMNDKDKLLLRQPSTSLSANSGNNQKSSSQKSDSDNYFKMDQKLKKNVSVPLINKKSSFIPKINKSKENKSIEKPISSIVHFDLLSIVNTKRSKKNRISLDWHDYAKMRMPYLPNIFKISEETQALVRSSRNIDIKNIKQK